MTVFASNLFPPPGDKILEDVHYLLIAYHVQDTVLGSNHTLFLILLRVLMVRPMILMVAMNSQVFI